MKTLPPHLERVAYFVSLGLSNKEMAGRLGLTPGTIADYVRKARDITGAHNRSELMRWYLIKEGKLKDEPPLFGPS